MFEITPSIKIIATPYSTACRLIGIEKKKKRKNEKSGFDGLNKNPFRSNEGCASYGGRRENKYWNYREHFVISRRNFAKVWPTIIAHPPSPPPPRALHIFPRDCKNNRDVRGKVGKGRRHEWFQPRFNHLRVRITGWNKSSLRIFTRTFILYTVFSFFHTILRNILSSLPLSFLRYS